MLPEMLRSQWPSLLWAVGFAAFLAPCAVPEASRYVLGAFTPGDSGISFYLLVIFVSVIYMYYWVLSLYLEKYNNDKAEKDKEQQVAPASALRGEKEEKFSDETTTKDTTSQMSPAVPGDIEEGMSPSSSDATKHSLLDSTKQEPKQGQKKIEQKKIEAARPVAIPEKKAGVKKPRSYFLDNVKIFLTINVVLFHLVLGFGATFGYLSNAGLFGWVLRVGFFESTYSWVMTRFFTDPSQGYFMPLFFFISAYFVPRSFAKKGRMVFIQQRAQRIFVGAFIVTFVLHPLCEYIAFKVAFPGMKLYQYNISAGPSWFLWWLLFFNLWYAFTAANREQKGSKLPFSKYFQKIPGFASRWLAGIVICGLMQWAVNVYLLREMPVASLWNAPGGLVCDLLFFYVGLLAGENQWFATDKPKIHEQIGINIWLFRALVLAEYVLIGLQPWSNTWPLYNNVTISETGQGITAFIFYGIWCVDMALALLEFFQSFVDFRNPLTLFLAGEAYGAYLVHNICVTLAVAIFAWTYNGEPPLEFTVFAGVVSSTPIPIPTLVTGFIYAALVWVPLTWVFAFCLRKMPLLEHVL